MTIMTDEEYLASGGSRCPRCHGHGIEGEPVEIDSNIAWQDLYCTDCGYQWRDLYKLTGFEEIKQ